MARPYWRNVVYIDIVEPKKPTGNGSWFLSLDCGHHKSVSRRRLMDLAGKVAYAPQRVICGLCRDLDVST